MEKSQIRSGASTNTPHQKSPDSLKLRFSKPFMTTEDMVVELILFAAEKRERGEQITYEDLPLIADENGVCYTVMLATEDFEHLRFNFAEMRKRNGLVLFPPRPNA